MSITTYAQLQTAIGAWHQRSNFTTGNIQEWIALFEACANRRLRVRQMETSATVTMSSGAGTLPTDFLQWRQVKWPGSTARNLEYVDRAYMEETYPDSPSGTPEVFTIEGETISVMPVDNTSLTLRYYQKIPALTDSATTNWLLTAHPDLYLFGSLVESNAFIRNEMGMVWKQRRDEIFDEIVALHTKSKSPAQIRPQGIYTP